MQCKCKFYIKVYEMKAYPEYNKTCTFFNSMVQAVILQQMII